MYSFQPQSGGEKKLQVASVISVKVTVAAMLDIRAGEKAKKEMFYTGSYTK